MLTSVIRFFDDIWVRKKLNRLPFLVNISQPSPAELTNVVDRKWKFRFAELILSRLRSVLSIHVCSLSFEDQGAFPPSDG